MAVNKYTIDKRILDILGLRHKIFCEELKTTESSNLEYDIFDLLGVHFAYLENDKIQGTVRLLEKNNYFGNMFGFKMEEDYDMSQLDSIGNLGEVARSCVISSKRNTKIIFYLWNIMAKYALDNGIEYLCTLAAPETDSLLDSDLVYNMAQNLGLVYEGVSVVKLKSDIYLENPRFPIFSQATRESIDLSDKKLFPKLMNLYNKLGFKVIGEPVFNSQFRMCNIPMIGKSEDLYKTTSRFT